MRRLVSLVGELLVTVGAVLLLFAVYQLVWTNVESDRASADELSQLDKIWAASPAVAPTDGATPGAPPGSGTIGAPRVPSDLATPGAPLARIRIPRLGADWVEPIIEGTTTDDLAKGIGHYLDTAAPGQLGNFALAGHRATHGEPWRNLNQMKQGDLVVVETRTTVFTYVITAPWYLVSPTQLGVIDPVPDHPGATPTQKLITLTTCNPRWASTTRLVVPGVLQSSAPRVATAGGG